MCALYPYKDARRPHVRRTSTGASVSRAFRTPDDDAMARVDVERAARASSAREASDAGRRALAMGEHALARAFYDDALAMMTEDATDEARDEREGRRRRAEVMANQSACALAVEAWDDAMERAERAIACDEGYAKAHARRAAARYS